MKTVLSVKASTALDAGNILINDKYDKSQQRAKEAVAYAIECGEELLAQQERLYKATGKQTGFVKWAIENTHLNSKPSVHNLMRLAREKSSSKIDDYMENNANPTVTGAIDSLRPAPTPRVKDPAPSDKDIRQMQAEVKAEKNRKGQPKKLDTSDIDKICARLTRDLTMFIHPTSKNGKMLKEVIEHQDGADHRYLWELHGALVSISGMAQRLAGKIDVNTNSIGEQSRENEKVVEGEVVEINPWPSLEGGKS